MPRISKKLVLILTMSRSIIETSKKDNMILRKILYIYYSIWFKKNKVKALIDSSHKINAMLLKYA